LCHCRRWHGTLMPAIVFPKRRVAWVWFLVWMQERMLTMFAYHDCFGRCRTFLPIRLTHIIVLNCLMKPVPRCVSDFVLHTNPMESSLFTESMKIQEVYYLKNKLWSCQSHWVIFDHEKVITQACCSWKLREEGHLRCTTCGPRCTSAWARFSEADLRDWFFRLNVLRSHEDLPRLHTWIK